MKSAVLTLLSCFVLSLTACEKLPIPAEQEEKQEEQKKPENNGGQNGNENTHSMTMNITAGGKTVIPFTTHEGSGWGNGLKDLKSALPTATIAKGLCIQGSNVGTSMKQIETFVNASK